MQTTRNLPHARTLSPPSPPPQPRSDALPRHGGRRQRVHTSMPDMHPAVPATARQHAFLEEAPLQSEDKLRVVVVLLQRPVPMTVQRRRNGRLRAPERRRSTYYQLLTCAAECGQKRNRRTAKVWAASTCTSEG